MVGALLSSRSVPAAALLIVVRDFQIIHSADTWAELVDVLNRPRFAAFAAEREKLLGLLLGSTRLFSGPLPLISACRDPNDDKYLALAQASEAVAIVSSDQDLRVLSPWSGIPILSPAEFVQAASALAGAGI